MTAPDEWADDQPVGGSERPDAATEPYYPDVYAWFTDFFSPMYRRSYTNEHRIWCDQWWRHPEALARLDALWRAWEHLRLDPGLGMSVWWRDHVDPHMAMLQSPDGCLKGCGAFLPAADGSETTSAGHKPRVLNLGYISSPLVFEGQHRTTQRR